MPRGTLTDVYWSIRDNNHSKIHSNSVNMPMVHGMCSSGNRNLRDSMKEDTLNDSANACAVLLYYHYFTDKQCQWWTDPIASVKRLYNFQKHLCEEELNLTGRILIAEEGINGTVAGRKRDIEMYIQRTKDYHSGQYFQSVDWKVSTAPGTDNKEFSSTPLFPDLKICIVKEIVSTGGQVDVHDILEETGQHLSPEEFHKILSSSNSNSSDEKQPEIALIDVRNTFEHNIGHFVHPTTGEKAMDPQMTTFASFDKFCEDHKESLKDKHVLMYCTGGIRCEKASVLLKRKGVANVSQLEGGIQRYLDKYGNKGYFKGLNFTFDKRVALRPDGSAQCTNCDPDRSIESIGKDYEVVGQCVECATPFDELCGSRVCTVCRDLVLVCTRCQETLREYHCSKHATWKDCYFSFLESFDCIQLAKQKQELQRLKDGLPPTAKNTRRALLRQIGKVDNRIKELEANVATVEMEPQRRCRSCLKPYSHCDGRCWGFWKDTSGLDSSAGLRKGRRGKQTSLTVLTMMAMILFFMALVPSGASAHAFSLQPIFSPYRRRYRSRGYQRRSAPRRPMTEEEYQSHFLDDDNWMTDKKTRLWNGNRSNRTPNKYSWTSLLVFSNVISYIAQYINPRITDMGVKISQKILNGQELYRLITPVFLHGSPIHLFTNMYSLKNIGPMVEQCFGSGRFLALYLISGATGNMLSAMQSPNPALGASGAVFGIFGAMYVFLNRNDWLLGEQGEAFSSSITQTLLINLAIGYMNPMVDNWGHLGGAIGGAAMAYYFGPRLFIAKLPNDGGPVIVDKPIVRLPPAIEHVPKNINNSISRLRRRMNIWRFKEDLPGKPWQPKEIRRSDYSRRKYMPNKSIKPKIDD